jgi:hypothetical protein
MTDGQNEFGSIEFPLSQRSRLVQPFFFVSHPAALFTYEFWISDNITELFKIFIDIIFLPFAKQLFFFGHFVSP